MRHPCSRLPLSQMMIIIFNAIRDYWNYGDRGEEIIQLVIQQEEYEHC